MDGWEIKKLTIITLSTPRGENLLPKQLVLDTFMTWLNIMVDGLILVFMAVATEWFGANGG
jgi:hypothetical protein